MNTISIDYDNQVAVIKLNRGILNSINLELIHELSETIKSIQLDSNLESLVIGSSNEKFFSIGFDIPGLFDLPKEDFAPFYPSFNRLCLD